MWAWPSVPERIPYHFAFSGRANAWTDRSVLAWFGLWLLAAGLTTAFHLVGEWTKRTPQLWNVPEKARFLALSDEQRAPIHAAMRTFLDGIAVAIIVLFGVMQYGIYAVATGSAERLPLVVEVATILFGAGVLVAAVLFNRAVKRLILRA